MSVHAKILTFGGLADSILYLTLSQATALNFLAPMGAMILSRYTDHGTFSSIDRVGTAVALAGVVMVTQPDGIFRSHEAMPLGPQPDTFAKVKGLACGAVGVLGTTVSSKFYSSFSSGSSNMTDATRLAADCFDDDASHRVPSSSSHRCELLRMGNRACRHIVGHRRSTVMATDPKVLGIFEHSRRIRGINGTSSSG